MTDREASPDRWPAERRWTVQRERLRALVARLRGCGSEYWNAKLAGVPDGSELERLPFTEKDEFRRTYPFGMLAVPARDVVRVHASSGTSGKPTVVAYTAGDIAVFAEVVARSLQHAGASRDDVIQVAYGYGLFTGGLGLHYGAELLGAATVPASGGNVPLQLQLLADLGASGLCCTPSFALLLAERAAAARVAGLKLRYGVLGAEPWSESLRAKLERSWSELTGHPFDACDIYGLSEVIGPGVAMECREGKGGLHVLDDHFLAEIVDPGSSERVPEGELGELVLTTLTKQALPVLRYRTRDLTRFVAGACPCGRTTRRIARFAGRVDDMLVIRGVNVFPTEIERVVLADPETAAHYAVVVDRRAAMAELEVRVELGRPGGSHPQVAERLSRALTSVLRLRTRVTVLDPGGLPRPESGKAQRVFERLSERDPLGA